MPHRSQNPARQLVGREAQLSVAAAQVADLADSRGALLLLTGDPGIGKTRLAEEVVSLAREGGARSIWATAWQGEGAPPLWPWAQVLRQLGTSEEALRQFATESPAASPAARFAQAQAVAEVIREVARTEPLVIVLDDLQWVDAASIRVLSHVAQAAREWACLIVGTYRSDELDREHVAELARVGVTLAVPPLTDDDAAELLHNAVGGAVADSATGMIIERSGGNPLFVWEFGQLLADSGRFDVASAGVPVAVAAIIERRLARLSENAVALLRSAAIAGNPFTVEAVAEISQVPIVDTEVGLHAAAGVGVIAFDDRTKAFRFSHDLVRDVVLDGIDPLRRAELHRRAAASFEQRLPVDPSFHAVVADHLERAGPAHADAAASQWELAGHAAKLVLAHDQAAACFARAARNSSSDRRRRAELLVEEGDSLLLTGDLEQARERFLDAAKLAQVIADPELLARAVLGIGAGPVAWEVPLANAEQITLLVKALDSLNADAIRLRSMLLARLSVAAATPETMDTARQRAGLALELAQEVQDPALVAQALAAVNDSYAGPAHTMTRRENADAIVELAVTAGDQMLELLGYRFRIVADLEVGDVPAVDRNIAAFTRLAGQLRQPLVSWYVPLFQGMRALLAGDLESADRYRIDVVAAAHATSSPNAEMMATALLMGICVAGEQTLATDILDGVIDLDPAEWATVAAGTAMVKLSAGEHDRARDLLHLHVDNSFARLGDDGEHLTTLLLFGRVAVALDELAAADAVYQLLQPHAGLWAVDGIAGCCWGPVELELGRLALALGRIDDARDHLRRARASAEGADAPLILADALALSQRCSQSRDQASVTDAGGGDDTNRFRRDGQFWTLSYRGHTIRMKDAKGLRDLARLLATPNREIHVLELVGSHRDPAGHALAQAGDLGEMLDTRARAEYRRRLAELEDDLADAERCADLARAERARAERNFIAAELTAALGLGGRPRRSGDPAERARKAVAGRIRLTIGRIEEEHPDLARHLTNTVNTGTYCVYRPETPTDWTM